MPSSIETIRTEIISQNSRTSYFASKRDYYDFYIDVLQCSFTNNSPQGFRPYCPQASRRARAISLLDLLNDKRRFRRGGVTS